MINITVLCTNMSCFPMLVSIFKLFYGSKPPIWSKIVSWDVFNLYLRLYDVFASGSLFEVAGLFKFSAVWRLRSRHRILRLGEPVFLYFLFKHRGMEADA